MLPCSYPCFLSSIVYIAINPSQPNRSQTPFWLWLLKKWSHINTFRPRQDGRHFPDDIFKCIFLNENVSISIRISLEFVPKGPINNIPSLVQIMVWRRPGDKPLSEPMMVSLLTHICVTRPQWLKCTHWASSNMPPVICPYRHPRVGTANIYTLCSNLIFYT